MVSRLLHWISNSSTRLNCSIMSTNEQTATAASKLGQPKQHQPTEDQLKPQQPRNPKPKRRRPEKQDTNKILLKLTALQVTYCNLSNDHCREFTTRRKSIHAESAGLVEKVMDRESRNIDTDRQEAIISDSSKLLTQIRQTESDPLAHQNMYDRIAWFDICWKDYDLEREAELLGFAKWRENCLFHEVVTFRITANYTPEWVKMETELFLKNYGRDSTGRTLAIINYGGHGASRDGGLKLCSHKR